MFFGLETFGFVAFELVLFGLVTFRLVLFRAIVLLRLVWQNFSKDPGSSSTLYSENFLESREFLKD